MKPRGDEEEGNRGKRLEEENKRQSGNRIADDDDRWQWKTGKGEEQVMVRR